MVRYQPIGRTLNANAQIRVRLRYEHDISTKGYQDVILGLAGRNQSLVRSAKTIKCSTYWIRGQLLKTTDLGLMILAILGPSRYQYATAVSFSVTSMVHTEIRGSLNNYSIVFRI